MDNERVDLIFSRIEEIDVELDSDPISRGPKYLNTLVAECRNYLTEIQKYSREILKEKLTLDRRLNVLEASYELRYNDLMSNDASVQAQPSAKDREAKVNDILADLRSDIRDTKNASTELGHVHTIVDSKLKELRDVNRDIKLQKSLIEDEIKTGNFWGDDQESKPKKIEHAEMEIDPSVLLPPDKQNKEAKDIPTLGSDEEDSIDLSIYDTFFESETPKPTKAAVNDDFDEYFKLYEI